MKLLRLSSLLLGLVVLYGEISFIQNQCFTELNVQYGGVDLTSSVSSTNTIGSCCTDCCANPSCNSWTYDLLTRKCTLKSTTPVRVKCATSGSATAFMGASGNKPASCAASSGGVTTSTAAVTTSTAAVTTVTQANPTASTTAGPRFCYNEANTTYAFQPVSAVVLGTVTSPASPGECCSQCAKVYPTCKSWTFFPAIKVCTLYGQIATSSGDRKPDPGNTSGTVIV